MKKELERFRYDKEIPKFDDEPIRLVLQETMPILHRSIIGRMRLIRALETKFGQNYKNYEAPLKALKHFDGEVEHLRSYIKLKRKNENG